MTKKTFMQGAAVLAGAGVVIKLMGGIFKIPLGNLIGGEGMGYFQTAYTVYVIFLTIAVSGAPIALSKMVSERIASGNYYGANKVFRTASGLLLAIGAFSFLLCFFGAGFFFSVVDNTKAAIVLRAVSPALLFLPVAAVFRGYFQGFQNMKPTAASQIVEQFFRVTAGLLLAFLLVSFGKDYGAAGAAFGASAGALACLVTIFAIYLRRRPASAEQIRESRPEQPEKTASILGQFLAITIPVTIGASIMPVMNVIDLTIVMRRLQDTGWTALEANTMYGQLSGMAAPLINLPQVMTMAIAVSMVPAVASAYKQKDMEFLRENAQLGMRTAILIGLPCTLGFMILSKPIMLLLYPLKRADAAGAAPCLFIMAGGVLLLSTFQTMTGVLQGIGKQSVPVINLFIGAVVKVILSYILIGYPQINVKGAAFGTVAAYLVATALNYGAVRYYTKIKFDFAITFLRPALTGLGMGVVTFVFFHGLNLFLGEKMSTLITIPAAGAVYVILLFKTGAVTREEVKKLPKGQKILKIVGKIAK